MGKTVKVYFDAEGDFLEVILADGPGVTVATADDAVMKRIDEQGKLLGFSILGVSKQAKEKHPLLANLDSGAAA